MWDVGFGASLKLAHPELCPSPARDFLSRAVIPGATEPTRSNILRMNLSPTPRFELDTVHLGICPCM